MRAEHERGPAGRFAPGLPRISDGALLFLLCTLMFLIRTLLFLVGALAFFFGALFFLFCPLLLLLARVTFTFETTAL